MRILSATEAVSPAVERTKLVLFTPFRVGRSWKLAMTGYLGYASVLYLPAPLLWLAMFVAFGRMAAVGAMGMPRPGLPAWLLPVACGVVAVALLVWTWVYHLCTRLGFSFFDIVLNKGEFVRPAWRRYGAASRQWTLVKVAYGSVVTLLMAAPIVAYMRHLFVVLQTMPQLSKSAPGSPEAMAQMMRFEAALFSGSFLIFFGFVAAALIASTAADFMVPSLALGGTTMREAFRRLWLLARHEPGQLIGYTAMKLLLAVGGYMGSVIAIEIVALLVFGIVGGLTFGIGYGLYLVHVWLPLLIGAAVLVALLCYVALIWAMTLAIGIVVTFLQAYLLYFLGGRYGLVGEALERSTPQRTASAYPAFGQWPPQFGQAQPYAPPMPPGVPPEV